jgi:hypothetical protein
MYLRWFVVVLLILTCALPGSAQSPPPANVYVFPLMVDGITGGFAFKSIMKIASTDNTTGLNCTLQQRNTGAQVTGLDGFLYETDVLDAGFSPLTQSVIQQHLNRPTEILHTSGTQAQKTGYAKLSCPNTVQTQLQFAYFDPNNNKIGESTIFPATMGNSFQFQIDTRDGTRMGFSLVNDSAVQGKQFEVIARDQFNQVVAFNLNDTVQDFSQVSKFVDQELKLPANFFGTIEIVGVPGGQSYAVGLQFTGSIFSTVQPLVRSTPLPF